MSFLFKLLLTIGNLLGGALGGAGAPGIVIVTTYF